MKTERRHDLQTNELSIWLKDFLDKVGPHRNLILGVVCIGILALLVITQLARRSEQKKAAAWASYFAAAESNNENGFGIVANTFSGTKAAQWAQQTDATMNLRRGSQLAFANKDESRKSLTNAKDGFASVLKTASDEILRKRAMVGLAQAHESLGEFNDAVTSYKKITEQFPGSVIAKLAGEQITRLENPSTREFQDWFASQEPASGPLSNSGLFQDLDQLPSDPNIEIPEPGSLIKPDGNAGAGIIPLEINSPSGTVDATGESSEASVDEFPIDESPVDESPLDTPADTDKPADTDTSASEESQAADTIESKTDGSDNN